MTSNLPGTTSFSTKVSSADKAAHPFHNSKKLATKTKVANQISSVPHFNEHNKANKIVVTKVRKMYSRSPNLSLNHQGSVAREASSQRRQLKSFVRNKNSSLKSVC